MKIDMHVHTSKYSSCAHMTPKEMATAALANGLDGVAITEHDYLWSVDEIFELQKCFSKLKIFRGAEISTAQGHVLVYGISSIKELYTGISLGELVKYVHQHNGFAVIAHPCRYSDIIPEEIFTTGIDGLEVRSNNVLVYMKDAIQLIQSRLNIPGIAGSDAHRAEDFGMFATDFYDYLETEQEIISAIKSNLYKIYMNNDRINTINDNITEKIKKARILIEKGIPGQELKSTHRISYSFQYGVKNNKDMRIYA